jgi:hypothetical protein
MKSDHRPYRPRQRQREVANNKKRAPSLIPHNFAKVATDDINIVTNLPTDPSLRRHRNQTMNTTSPPSPSIAMMPIKLEDAVAVANNDSTPFPTSSSATVPIKLEDAEVNNDGTPSPLSSIATMPIKQEDAVAAVANNYNGIPSPPSSTATVPIKLEDAEINNNDGTPTPPSSIAAMPNKQEDAVAAVANNDGDRFDDAKTSDVEPIDDANIITAITTTSSPASLASGKRSVQDTSEATSKRAKLVENSNAAAKGCEQDGDREAIVKTCITAFQEGNEAESKKLSAIRKMRADWGKEEIARLKQKMEDLFSGGNMTLEEEQTLMDFIRYTNASVDCMLCWLDSGR